MRQKQKLVYKGVIIGMMIILLFLSVSFVFFNAPFGFSSNSESGISESKNNIVPVKIQDDPDFDAFITGSYKKGSSLVVELYHNSEAVQPIGVFGLRESEYTISKKESLKNEKVTLTIPDWNNRYFKLKVGYSSEVFEFGIKILNVQSYPTVGGNWTVMFNTTGKADLRITAVNGTEFGKDLIFLEVRCGDKILNYTWNNNSILIENYECSETGYETSKVLTAGKHHLEFRFGEDVEYASNYASVLSSLIIPENVILITMNDEYNKKLLDSLLAIEKTDKREGSECIGLNPEFQHFHFSVNSENLEKKVLWWKIFQTHLLQNPDGNPECFWEGKKK